jgi:amidophosphoribosyltransferase
LLASNLALEDIATHLNADSVGYLSLEGLLAATGVAEAGFCTACLTGTYPTEVFDESDKYVLER